MMKRSFILFCLVLSACQSVPTTSLPPDPHLIAQNHTCGQMAYHINELNIFIDDQRDAQSTELVKNTAISAAKTGVNQSGALGGAGAYAGIGMNFLTGLYNIDSKKRQQEALNQAEIQLDLLYEAYDIKGCAYAG